MRREDVKIEINGLGEFHALVKDVNEADEMLAVDHRRILIQWLTPEGAAIANKLPRWQRVIVVAGILHALN